jgi:hypothetical protein
VRREYTVQVDRLGSGPGGPVPLETRPFWTRAEAEKQLTQQVQAWRRSHSSHTARRVLTATGRRTFHLYRYQVPVGRAYIVRRDYHGNGAVTTFLPAEEGVEG